MGLSEWLVKQGRKNNGKRPKVIETNRQEIVESRNVLKGYERSLKLQSETLKRSLNYSKHFGQFVSYLSKFMVLCQTQISSSVL